MEDKNKVFLEKNKVFKNGELNVKNFNELEAKLQAAIIEDILSGLYTGTKELKIDEKYVLKCLKLTCDEFDNNIHLPLGLLVKKENNTITFEFQKKIGIYFIIALLGALLFTIVGATYSAFNYIKLMDLNKDIDGDGVADINIDTNNDEEPEINIDLNKDDTPDVNIDYKGNREATFNVVNEDETANPINVLDDKGVCIRNCDVDKDGWPDTNLDLKNTGKATVELDLNNDGKADLNLDMDGNGVCDLHCDTNADNECDKYCLEDVSKVIISKNGSSQIVGKPNITNKTATLEIDYVDLSDVVIENIVPDDMIGEGSKIPDKIFTVENKSIYYVSYNLKWIVTKNTFTSQNFKFKVACTPNCKTLDYTTAPLETTIFLSEIMIPPKEKHSYVISFKLQGVNEPQNYDKDKTFIGKVEVGYGN